MNELLFIPGQEVKYKSQSAAGVDMRRAVIVGYQDVHENLWTREFCKASDTIRPKRVSPGNGVAEDRYVIEHFYGWNPSNQKGLNPDLDLSLTRRYEFAFESELSDIDA